LLFVGSIKWLGTPFDGHDLSALRRAAVQVPGHDPAATGLVVASLSGFAPEISARSLDLVWNAQDVVTTWRSGG
jgi:hypothetical protein